MNQRALHSYRSALTDVDYTLLRRRLSRRRHVSCSRFFKSIRRWERIAVRSAHAELNGPQYVKSDTASNHRFAGRSMAERASKTAELG
jgi:hypothetical protein